MAKLFTKKKTGKLKKTLFALPREATPLAGCETILGVLEVYVPAGTAASKYTINATGTKTGMLNVLVVEDSPADIYLIRRSLSMGEIPKYLSVVTDGEEALEFLTRSGRYNDAPRPDLILLDLNLPKMDGREVLEKIKADPDLRRIPVLVLSTSRSDRDVSGAYEHHANCYLAKPSELDEYLDVVRAIETYWLSCVALPGG